MTRIREEEEDCDSRGTCFSHLRRAGLRPFSRTA